ncbi:MAG TPA: hypothetical protein V6C52_10965 [Coleofasciculaceae cyanobacterium]|jgi:hypothetical protein
MICEQCFGRLIFVHGHYQCDQCHRVALTCCDGETACITLEE